MLLEMQNAMNNMMSKNSQLHNMLHGDQSSSLPMEAMSSDASSSSSSSSSSTSESPSCSSPSSPQCPQDSEFVVSMDTNSSSASSCASDSSEDEGVAAVSRQNQDAFGQQRPPTPDPVVAETSCSGGVEQQLESSNCWNNNSSAAAGGHQRCPYSGGATNSAYREERAAGELHTQTFSRYSGPNSCVKSRAYLVSKNWRTGQSLKLLQNTFMTRFVLRRSAP